MATRESTVNKVVETVGREGAAGLTRALSGLTVEEVEELKVQADAALRIARRDQREEDSERRAVLREMAAVGEALVWEMIHCGNCRRCGYRKHGATDAAVRPHGPYPYLWSWGRGGRLVKRYVKRSEVEEVKVRLQSKQRRARRAREELRRARRGGSPNPATVEEIERMEISGTLDEDSEIDRITEGLLVIERAKSSGVR